MSNVKERIFGAVTIMSEEDAVKVWNLIQGAVALSNAEEVAPYPDELAAIAAYKAGDPDYQPSISQEDLMKELKLLIKKKTGSASNGTASTPKVYLVFSKIFVSSSGQPCKRNLRSRRLYFCIHFYIFINEGILWPNKTPMICAWEFSISA